MGRVIITGGTGFIGSRLGAALVDQGHEVVVLTRGNPSGRETSRNGTSRGVTLATWDGRSGEGWSDLLEGAWGVVNLAGAGVAEGRWTRARKELIRSSRVNAGRAVMDALGRVDARPEVLVQGSAVGYYGMDREDCGENVPPGRGFLAETAREWEASTEEAEALGVRRVVIRTGVVLGPGGGALAKMLTPFRLFLGGPLGSGRQPFPWIHMADQVGAIIHLMSTPALEGPFNLAAPEPPDNRTFCKALGRALNRPCFLPAPALALKVMLGEMATEMLLSGQRARPDRLLANGYAFRFPDLDQALADILNN